jgi:hypothetical protein
MVAVSALAIQLTGRSETWVSETLFATAGLLSIPAVPIIALIGALLDWCGLKGWSAAAAAAPCYWLGWYGIIRFLEWRSFSTAPVPVIPAAAPAPSSTPARK